MTAGYLLFLVVGKLFIYIGGKFVRDNEIKTRFLNRLLSCSLCLGVWVYTIMSAITGYYVFEDFVSYKLGFSELAAGCFSAILMYYVEMGWRSLHEEIVIS